MKLTKKIIAILLSAIILFSIAPIVNYKAEAATAYPKIEALKVPRIYQKSSEINSKMCHVNSYASIIAYKLGTYSYDGYKRTYSYGTDYNYTDDPVWNKMLDVHYSYDPIGGALKYPVPITNRQVSGNTKETYEIIYEQLAMGNPVVVYSSTNAHASVVIGYTASTNSLDVSKFTVMEISDSWKNSKSIFDTYANAPMTSSSTDSCYMTLKAWLSRGGYKLKSVSYYSEPNVTVNTSYSEYSVGETNAVLCGEVANPTGAKISKGGIKLYDASGKLLKNYSQTFSYTDNLLYIWYNIKSEVGYTLSPGTAYQYQLYAVVGGTTYTSRMATFTTTGTTSHTLSVYYNANGGSISSDTYYLSSGNIYKKSDSSILVHKWTYNEPQKYGLYDYTTFGISKSGYEFLGWSTTPSGELWFDQNDTDLLPTHLNPDIKNGNCSVTMYAVWKKVSTAYTLTYDANGGSGAPALQSGAASYTVSSTEPTRNGYNFLGWSTSSSAISATYFVGESIILTQNTTLYAVWEEVPVYNIYNLIYDANGGSGAPEFHTFTEGSTVTVSDEIPVCFGYKFNGWYTADGEWYYPGDKAVFSGNTTLYASWTASFSSVYSTLTLVFDDETQEHYVGFAPEQSGYYVIETVYTEDNLDTIGKLYSSSGDFIAESDDDENNRNFRISHYLNENEIYFISVKSYKELNGSTVLKITRGQDIVFDANGGYGAPEKLTGDYRYILPFEEPHRDGYVFVGWSTDKNNNNDIKQPGDTIVEITGTTITCVTTLYAVWEKVCETYTLSYDANGGNNAPSIQTGATCYTISTIQPTRSGYHFLGWATNINAETANYYPGESITLIENTTLYAVWDEIVYYTLVYNANGGFGAPESKDFQGGTSIHISKEIPTRNGYVFKGWVTENNCLYYPNQEVFLFNNTTLYASWEKSAIVPNVSIRNPSATTINYGDSIILHADLDESLPNGYYIEWTADNGNFNYSANGDTCRIDPNKSGSTAFTATVYDAQGNAVSKDEQTMTSKAGFFDKIIAFFEKLFGLTKVIPQAFKGVL